MKKTWDNLTAYTQSFKDEFEALLNILPDSAAIYKQQKRLDKAWRKLQSGFNQMDEFVSPMIKSVEVNSPLLKDADFIAKWKFWKEYLIEQHNIHVRSRSELMALKRLSEITNEKPAIAIKYLEFAMAGNYTRFFVVNQTEMPTTETPKNEKGAMIVSMPAQYTGNDKQPHQTTLEEQIEKESKNSKSK